MPSKKQGQSLRPSGVFGRQHKKQKKVVPLHYEKEAQKKVQQKKA